MWVMDNAKREGLAKPVPHSGQHVYVWLQQALPAVVFVLANIQGNIIKASAISADVGMTVEHALKGKRGRWKCEPRDIYFTACAPGAVHAVG